MLGTARRQASSWCGTPFRTRRHPGGARSWTRCRQCGGLGGHCSDPGTACGRAAGSTTRRWRPTWGRTAHPCGSSPEGRRHPAGPAVQASGRSCGPHVNTLAGDGLFPSRRFCPRDTRLNGTAGIAIEGEELWIVTRARENNMPLSTFYAGIFVRHRDERHGRQAARGTPSSGSGSRLRVPLLSSRGSDHGHGPQKARSARKSTVSTPLSSKSHDVPT